MKLKQWDVKDVEYFIKIIKGRNLKYNNMEKINKFIDWLMISSKNPQNLALTVKGLLVSILPIAIILINKFVEVDISADAGALVDTIGNVIIAIGGLVSVCMTGFGLARKIYLKIRKID